jgi:hypothetical protein
MNLPHYLLKGLDFLWHISRTLNDSNYCISRTDHEDHHDYNYKLWDNVMTIMTNCTGFGTSIPVDEWIWKITFLLRLYKPNFVSSRGWISQCISVSWCVHLFQQATKAQRGIRGIALLIRDLGARRGWVVSTTPRPLYPPGNTLYPLYRRLDGPQGRSGRVRKISPPPGFDPWTVQPVASRVYTCTFLQIEFDLTPTN